MGKLRIKFKSLPIALAVMGIFFLSTFSNFAFAYFLPQIDKSLTIIAMGKTYNFFYPEIDVYKGRYYLKNAEEVVEMIYYDTLEKPIDAKVSFTGDNTRPFKFSKEINGKSVDRDSLLIAIDKTLNGKEEKIIAKTKLLKPTLTVENLKKSTNLRSFFKTNYQYSTKERKENIKLAVSKIDGYILYPEQEFSFNQTVGERTKERGFQEAKIIENGKFTDGVGGGVCQVSSTLYNAVLLSGLKVSERHNHSMLVNYVEPSLDAMVSSTYADLKFINETGAIVFILGGCNDNEAWFSIYGVKNEYTYKTSYEIIEKIQPEEPERVESEDENITEERFLVYPKFGAKSEGFLEIYEGERLIERKKLSTDKYKPLRGVIAYPKSQKINCYLSNYIENFYAF